MVTVSGTFPFFGKSPLEVARSIISRNVNIESSELMFVSNDCKDLLLRLLEKDPKRRATALDVLKHPWIERHALISKSLPFKGIENFPSPEKSINFSKFSIVEEPLMKKEDSEISRKMRRNKMVLGRLLGKCTGIMA